MKSTAKIVGQTRVFNEEVVLRASLEGGAIEFMNGQTSRAVDRFQDPIIRGFDFNGMGPIQANEQLGGNYYMAARFEAEFPLGIPEEFGLSGGAFYDIGSIWGLDVVAPGVTSSGFEPRQVVGLTIFWDSPFGPLRMNFSNAFDKQPGDVTRNFDISVKTDF